MYTQYTYVLRRPCTIHHRLVVVSSTYHQRGAPAKVEAGHAWHMDTVHDFGVIAFAMAASNSWIAHGACRTMGDPSAPMCETPG